MTTLGGGFCLGPDDDRSPPGTLTALAWAGFPRGCPVQPRGTKAALAQGLAAPRRLHSLLCKVIAGEDIRTIIAFSQRGAHVETGPLLGFLPSEQKAALFARLL